MKRNNRVVVGAATLALALGGLGAGFAHASTTGESGPEDTDTPIAGSALDEAIAAALAHTGEGTVTATEVGDEESYYEVEVTLLNGSEVDVQLNESFVVVGAEPESGTDD